MIFVGGVSPRKKRLEEQPRICSSCGLSQAYLVRLDDYLSLFFIPILRIRKGPTVVHCERCGYITDESGRTFAPGTDLRATHCSYCKAALADDFHYCPYCGKAR